MSLVLYSWAFFLHHQPSAAGEALTAQPRVLALVMDELEGVVRVETLSNQRCQRSVATLQGST